MRFLDRSVQGIIVPHVNTREAAEAVARAARYYPEGHRGERIPEVVNSIGQQGDATAEYNDSELQ